MKEGSCIVDVSVVTGLHKFYILIGCGTGRVNLGLGNGCGGMEKLDVV